MADVQAAVKLYQDQGWTLADWPTVHGNAALAKQRGKASPFQKAVLTCAKDLQTILESMDAASAALLRTPSRWNLVSDFMRDRALGMRGLHLVKRERWEVETITLKELLWASEDRHNVAGLMYSKTLIFNGAASTGKCVNYRTDPLVLGCL